MCKQNLILVKKIKQSIWSYCRDMDSLEYFSIGLNSNNGKILYMAKDNSL